MFDNNDQEFLMFLFGCLCLSHAANGWMGLATGFLLIGMTYDLWKDNKDKD